MDYVNLGSTGLKVSRLCLGMHDLRRRASGATGCSTEEASRCPSSSRRSTRGINFFDTADIYSLGASEEVLGRALRELGAKRDQVVIATKVFGPMGEDPNERGLSRKHIMHAIDDSRCGACGIDYVDLYQIHRFDYDDADRGDARGADTTS